ncbi:hypothetical protein RhiirA4_446437 [Rhizophagus irregularis]|uniref:Uncharacterized protein n=1 Tax=Rhizophagus irregularis TaxID=588596 RepID=A0A2I1GVB7_9GLOM|nr:hypothetical protein RhiirA4_446437 [Rhizophagus irregularis]
MPNPFEYIRNRGIFFPQYNNTTLINLQEFVTKNNGGFNDVPVLPNNRNGVAGQNKNAIINFLTANGAVNYHDTVFLFRDGPALATCEHNLPQLYEKYIYNYLTSDNTFFLSLIYKRVCHQAAIPDVCTAAIRVNCITVRGLCGGSRIEFEPFDQAFNR